MGAKWPDATQVFQAIEIYLQQAYDGHQPPAAPRAAVATLRSWAGVFYDAPVFARTPGRCSLRLGNSIYPHMKLVLELEPDNKHYHFRADTHDAHIQLPADHPEHEAVEHMRRENAKIAAKIMGAWVAEGLPVGDAPQQAQSSAPAADDTEDVGAIPKTP